MLKMKINTGGLFLCLFFMLLNDVSDNVLNFCVLLKFDKTEFGIWF